MDWFFKNQSRKKDGPMVKNNNNNRKQERQIMHLALIMNTFQREEDKVEF